MENMSLLQFILVSFSEQVIFIFLILSTASLVTVISYILREKLGLVSEAPLLVLFADIILMIFIMRFNFYEAITSSVLGFSLIMLVEIPFSVIITLLLGINGAEELYQNAVNFAIFVLSTRLLQIVLAFLFYRFKFKVVNMENANIRTKVYYIQLIVYLISLCTIGFLTFLMTRMLIFASSQNVYLLRINIFISLFVTIILTLAVKNIHEFYKNKKIITK